MFNNVRGDQPDKLGLTYGALRDVNPRIVCCSLSGFGSTGPRAAEPGYDYLIQGYAGYMAVTGEPDGPPGKCGVSVIDFAGGYAAMLGLMVALFDAQRTGVGREVEVSLMDTAVSMLSYFATWTLNRDWTAGRTSDSGHQTLVPAQNFPTRDGWIVIFCAKEKFWARLVEIMGLPELARDPRFHSFPDRLRHKDALIALLRDRFRTRSTHRVAHAPPRPCSLRAGEHREPGARGRTGAGPRDDHRRGASRTSARSARWRRPSRPRAPSRGRRLRRASASIPTPSCARC